MKSTTISLPPAGRVTRSLLAVIFVLALLSTLGQVSKYFLGHPYLQGFVPAFYVDHESSVPTWYSSLALAFAAALFATIAKFKFDQRDRFRWHWAALATIVLLLSIDEIAMFHEHPIELLRNTFGATGLLYYTWVVPGMLFVVVLALAMLRFYCHLPRTTRRLLTLAAVVFLGGAIGVEMLSGVQASSLGEENFTYALIVTAEEFCEMLGVVILIHALIQYVHANLGGFQVTSGGSLPSSKSFITTP